MGRVDYKKHSERRQRFPKVGCKKLKKTKQLGHNCQVGAALTAYADICAEPAMMVMTTCSLMVNGPELRGIPKREIFGM
jgi:hypothetical protein